MHAITAAYSLLKAFNTKHLAGGKKSSQAEFQIFLQFIPTAGMDSFSS